jgi:hypothetical protein
MSFVQAPRRALCAAARFLGCDLEGNAHLYSETDFERGALIAKIRDLKRSSCYPLPVVGVVTFAAPRVGNKAYAQSFKGRSLMNPLQVAEPLNDSR